MNLPAEIEKSERKLYAPGWYKDIPNEDYHKSGGTSSSTLKYLIEKTGAHLQYKRAHPMPPSTSMEIGSTVHAMVLQPWLVDQEVAVMPEINGRTNEGKLAKQNFLAMNEGKIILTEDQFATAEAMATRVKEHPIASILLQDVVCESSVYWWYKSMDTDDDTRYREIVKVRPDALSRNHPIVIDLKTVRDASYTGFIRAVQDYYYHLSAAMYLEGVNQCRPLLDDFGWMAFTKFIFICVESEPPYEVACYELSSEYLDIGKFLYRYAMRKLSESRAANWPGFPEEVRIIEPPSYATRTFVV